MISALSNPPFSEKNFKPLRLKGKWLAVIITLPSQGYCAKRRSSFKSINIDGVVESPVETAFAPTETMPSKVAAEREGEESRLS